MYRRSCTSVFGGCPPGVVDELFANTNINRIYVTLGNHEPWSDITPLFNQQPGAAVRVSELTWLLPRPARLTIGGRAILSLGGAASVDKAQRREGADWWPDEAITDEQVAAAIAGGPVDLMLAHESPANTPVRPFREILSDPQGLPEAARTAAAASRARVSKAWDAVRPELLLHGHMHAPGGGRAEDGRRVVSLGSDSQEGSIAFLDLLDLTLETPSLQQLRSA